MDDKPKQRTIVFESYVLAYLGDYITMLEEGVKRMAFMEADKLKEEKEKSKKKK